MIGGLLGKKIGMTQVFTEDGHGAGHRDPGRALPGHAGEDGRDRRLRRRPARHGRPQAQERDEAGIRPCARGQGRTEAVHPRSGRTTAPTSWSSARSLTVEMFKEVAARGRHRHHEGQGIPGRHEAPRIPRPSGIARRVEGPPRAGLHRQQHRSRPHAPGHPHGRPHGQRTATPPRNLKVVKSGSREEPRCSSKAPSRAQSAAM